MLSVYLIFVFGIYLFLVSCFLVLSYDVSTKRFTMRNTLILIFFLSFRSLAQVNTPAPTGKLVDIGGYRLHVDINGKGSPAVIMIAGSQAFSFDWALVAPEIARATLTCTYDRPALAWSDPGPWRKNCGMTPTGRSCRSETRHNGCANLRI